MLNTGIAFNLISPRIMLNGPMNGSYSVFQPVCVAESERSIDEWEIDHVEPIQAKDHFSLAHPVYTTSHQMSKLQACPVNALKFGPRLFEDKTKESTVHKMLYPKVGDASLRMDPEQVLARMMESSNICAERIDVFMNKVLPHLSQALVQNALILVDALKTDSARCSFLKILASKKQTPSIKQIRLFLKLVTKYRDQFHNLEKYVSDYLGDSETRSEGQNGLYFELEVFELLDDLENVVIHNVGYAVGDSVIDFFVSIDGERCLIDAKKTLSTLAGFRKTRPNRPKPVRQVRAMLDSGYRTALITKSHGKLIEHDVNALRRQGVEIMIYHVAKRRGTIALPSIV